MIAIPRHRLIPRFIFLLGQSKSFGPRQHPFPDLIAPKGVMFRKTGKRVVNVIVKGRGPVAYPPGGGSVARAFPSVLLHQGPDDFLFIPWGEAK